MKIKVDFLKELKLNKETLKELKEIIIKDSSKYGVSNYDIKRLLRGRFSNGLFNYVFIDKKNVLIIEVNTWQKKKYMI